MLNHKPFVQSWKLTSRTRRRPRCLGMAAVLVMLAWSVASSVHAQVKITGKSSAVTYQVGQTQRIEVFSVGDNGRLYRNYWDGFQWQWADQGPPIQGLSFNEPAAITYYDSNGGVQRIYVFAIGSDGSLFVNYWDGYQWRWAYQGNPGEILRGRPAAITYLDWSGSQIIDVFVAGKNDHLYMNVWDCCQWQWLDQGGDSARYISSPTAVTYYYGWPRVYAFVGSGYYGWPNCTICPGPAGLYVNYRDGGWKWTGGGGPGDDPSAITYYDSTSGVQRTYVLTTDDWRGNNYHLYTNYWDGARWRWSYDNGNPGVKVHEPSAITYQDGGLQRIYTFTRGEDGHLYVNYWDGFQYQWADQGNPGVPVHQPEAITYQDGGVQRIYAFTGADDGHLYVNYWDGFQWRWADQGQPQ